MNKQKNKADSSNVGNYYTQLEEIINDMQTTTNTIYKGIVGMAAIGHLKKWLKEQSVNPAFHLTKKILLDMGKTKNEDIPPLMRLVNHLQKNINMLRENVQQSGFLKNVDTEQNVEPIRYPEIPHVSKNAKCGDKQYNRYTDDIYDLLYNLPSKILKRVIHLAVSDEWLSQKLYDTEGLKTYKIDGNNSYCMEDMLRNTGDKNIEIILDSLKKMDNTLEWLIKIDEE
jgi:hypothetical protein